MKPSALVFPGHKINEYLLVLSPQQDLYDKVIAVKEAFSHCCQAGNAHWGKPHITLVNFLQYAVNEGRLVKKLKTTGMSQHPFEVALNGFGSFPSHTVYINVATKEPIHRLVEAMRPDHELMALNKGNPPHFVNVPHMTVARKLLPWQYEKGWLRYSQMQFAGEFVADRMLLLRRQAGGKTGYQLVEKIELLGQPADVEQGKLFG